MIFSKVFKTQSIQEFDIGFGSGAQDSSVAYGPGSIINGSIKLCLNRPVKAVYIKVSFTCKDRKKSDTLFSVESDVWRSKNDDGGDIDLGAHLYLFAISIPHNVNYPPTITDDSFGHHIEYALQGEICLSDESKKMTSRLPLIYFPLVTFDQNPIPTERSLKLERNDELLLVSAKLVNPYSCPGDTCRIKLETHNQSSHNINQVYIQLILTTTSLKNNTTSPIVSTGPSYQHKRLELLNDSHYVSIPKHAPGESDTSICSINVPKSCIPTTKTHFANKYIDISYEIIIFIPTMGSFINDTKHLATHPNSIRLPLVVTTVPNLIPPLKISYSADQIDALPTFIPCVESPTPSPTTPEHHRWGPGSPIEPEDDHLLPQPIEDNSGHLMVPLSTSPARSISNKNTII